MGSNILNEIQKYIQQLGRENFYSVHDRVENLAASYLEKDDNDFASLVRWLTKSVTTYQKGRVSRFTEETVREPEREKHDIERWTMRYHAQVLYYLFRSCSDSDLHPREVQIMTWTHQGDSNQTKYFATNNNDVNKISQRFCILRNGRYILREIIQADIDRIKEFLRKPYIQQKIGANKADNIIEFLGNNQKMAALNNKGYRYANQYYKEGQDRQPNTHAERYLCLKAQDIRNGSEGEPTFSIYGTKRPCLVCAVQMKQANINNFNKNHGRLFLNTTEGLNKKERQEVVRKLIRENSYITRNHVTTALTTHYDTDSDREE